MAGSIIPGLIETVQGHIHEALAQTSEHSTLPEEVRDGLLAQACAQACDVLDGWVVSPEWNAMAPPPESAREPIASAIDDWNYVRQFLAPVMETLNRISAWQENTPGTPQVEDPSAYIDDMIAAIEYTGRRHPRMNRRDLFIDATAKTRALQRQVCAMAAELRDGHVSQHKKAERRSRAIRLLQAAGGLLLTLSLTMAGASPAAVRQDLPEWGHDVVNVLFAHQVAHTATPTARVAPSSQPRSAKSGA